MDTSGKASPCVSEVGEEAIEGNGSLASLASDEQARFFVMPALISKRKNSNEEIFYTSDIEQIAKMEKLQKEYLDKLGKRLGMSCHVHAFLFLSLAAL